MSDNLSQEDIDKLLNGGGAASLDSAKDKDKANPVPESVTESGSSPIHLTPTEVDALGEIGNMSMGAAATTLSMLLSNKVEITTPTVLEYKEIQELFKFQKDFLTVEIRYEDGLEGLSVFALNKDDSAIIADLMMGGNGIIEGTPEIGELQLSAVGEAMNQMIGSASTSLASIFNFPVNISPPDVKLQKGGQKPDLSQDIFGCPIIAVAFKFKIGDLIDSEMIQLMSLDSAKYQVKTLMEAMTTAVDEVVEEMTPTKPDPEPVPVPPPPPQPQYSAPPPPIRQQEPVTVQPVQFASFDDSPSLNGETNQNLDLLMDIKLKLTVELGRTELPIKKVLELTRGSVIELDKIAGEPVELFANGKLIAKGEVVVIEDNFGLRITSITSPDQRLKNI